MKFTLAFWMFILSLTSAHALEWGEATLRNAGRDEQGVNWIAIDFKMKKGWKTYWEFAGQNGLDPEITLTDGEDIIETDIHWPPPHLFVADDLPSVGYKGELTLPISFAGDGTLNLKILMGVCETVCVPIDLEFEIEAQDSYSVEQYVLQGAPTAPLAPECDWNKEALTALDPNEYWMFVSEGGVIEHEAPADFKTGQIYKLTEETIEALPCPV